MLLTPYTRRAAIVAVSATQVNFAAGSLTQRPIKLGAPSGRIASLTALPSAVTVSGGAGTKYLFAELAAPSGTPYGGVGGFLDRLATLLPWNREDWRSAFRCLFLDDGTLATAAQNSAVTLVVATSATPANSHQVPLGQCEWDGAAITSLTSYEEETTIAISAQVHGQCQLVYVSANEIQLIPKNGNNLVIDGTARQVPSAGVSLAPSGLTVGVTYWVYAFWTGSAIALEASTTARATHTNGIEIKGGDATRTLVGLVRINSGPAFTNSKEVRFVRSWFHDAGVGGNAVITADRTTASTSFVELHATEGKVNVLLWANEVILLTVSGEVTNNTSARECRTGIGIDGSLTPEPGVSTVEIATANEQRPVAVAITKTDLSETAHGFAVLVQVEGGTGTWEGTTSPRALALSFLTVRR